MNFKNGTNIFLLVQWCAVFLIVFPLFQLLEAKNLKKSQTHAKDKKHAVLTCNKKRNEIFSPTANKSSRLFVGDDYHCKMPGMEKLMYSQYEPSSYGDEMLPFKKLADGMSVFKIAAILFVLGLRAVMEFCDLSEILTNLYLYGTFTHEKDETEKKKKVPARRRRKVAKRRNEEEKSYHGERPLLQEMNKITTRKKETGAKSNLRSAKNRKQKNLRGMKK